MNVNKVSIELINPTFAQEMMSFIYSNDVLPLVNRDLCEKLGYDQLFVPYPLINLWNGAEPIGEHKMYYIIKVRCKNAYAKIQDVDMLDFDPVIDIVRNKDHTVLKINLSSNPTAGLLQEYHDGIMASTNNAGGVFSEFSPHIVLTYLNANVSDEDIAKVVGRINKGNISSFRVKSFRITNDSPKYLLNINIKR